MTKIREIDDSALVISRRKYGRGYSYFDEHGEKITDPIKLKRMRSLVIPPMWKEVMICRFEDGHIQATGRDLKGRKQYIYHSVYEKRRQEEKFRKMLDFGKALPKLRKRVQADIQRRSWTREKVLALILTILDEYGIRIGNRQYREENQTYGLTTLRRRHVCVEDGTLVLKFKGKRNKEREVAIDDNELARLIRKAAEQPGYELFRYRNEKGNPEEVDSDEVNAYISQCMGDDYSSKDFRTWTACRLAIEYYPLALEDQKEGSRKKFSNILIKMVADELGNTPTVCREYYVHPAIFNRVDTQGIPHPNPYSDATTAYGHTAAEKLALKIIAEDGSKAS